MPSTADVKLNRIEAAAVRLFADKGVAGTSVADIATAAQVAQGYLYRHWKDKDAMALDFFQRRYFAFRDSLADAAFPERIALKGYAPLSTRARIAALLQEGLRIYGEDPHGFRFLLLTQHQHLGRVPEGETTLVGVVQDVVSEGIGAGEIGLSDPAIATAIILGIFLQNATFDLYGDLGRPLPDVGDILADACWRAIQGRS